jgi:uncharacterized protein (DUF2249 family)
MELDMTKILNQQAYIFDARGVAKRFRHSAIFGALEALEDGEAMRFINDHDPIPLLQQIMQRYGDQVRIRYVAREPEQIVIDFVIAADGSSEPDIRPASGGDCSGGGGCGCGG